MDKTIIDRTGSGVTSPACCNALGIAGRSAGSVGSSSSRIALHLPLGRCWFALNETRPGGRGESRGSAAGESPMSSAESLKELLRFGSVIRDGFAVLMVGGEPVCARRAKRKTAVLAG